MSTTDFIDSDDPIVADLLASTIELVAEAGGWIAPTTTFVCRDGQLHVESTEEANSPLFHIPRAAFVRVDDATWSDNPEQLEMLSVADHLSDIEVEMLYVQVALHNQCKKLSWMSKTHPWLAPDLPNEVIEAVRAILPTFRIPAMTAADTLWANRCFKIALDNDEAQQRVLIPLVDLLNHHEQGAIGSWSGDSFDVTNAQPLNANECALNYGMNRDPLELAAVYGFVDSDSPYVPTSALSEATRTQLAYLLESCAKYPSSIACQIIAEAARRNLGAS